MRYRLKVVYLTKVVCSTLVVLSGLFGTSCGQLGGSSTPATANDALPTGTIIAQGQLVGQNGRSASGAVAVYSDHSGNYTVRLESLSVVYNSSLQLFVYSNSSIVLQTSLHSTSGNQNYSISSAQAGSATNFTSLVISLPANQGTDAYAIANLSNPNPPTQ